MNSRAASNPILQFFDQIAGVEHWRLAAGMVPGIKACGCELSIMRNPSGYFVRTRQFLEKEHFEGRSLAIRGQARQLVGLSYGLE